MDVLFDDANVKDLVLDLEDVTVIKKIITKVLSKDTSRKLKLRLDQFNFYNLYKIAICYFFYYSINLNVFSF